MKEESVHYSHWTVFGALILGLLISTSIWLFFADREIKRIGSECVDDINQLQTKCVSSIRNVGQFCNQSLQAVKLSYEEKLATCTC